jgi:hypothetical protein
LKKNNISMTNSTMELCWQNKTRKNKEGDEGSQNAKVLSEKKLEVSSVPVTHLHISFSLVIVMIFFNPLRTRFFLENVFSLSLSLLETVRFTNDCFLSNLTWYVLSGNFIC